MDVGVRVGVLVGVALVGVLVGALVGVLVGGALLHISTNNNNNITIQNITFILMLHYLYQNY